MNSVTQTMKYRQAVIKYATQCGVTDAAIRYRTKKKDETYEGICFIYIPAKDNEPEIDSIAIGLPTNENVEFYITQIKDLETTDHKRKMIN